MTINFYLITNSNKNPEQTIYAYLRSIKGIKKTFYINIGERINPKYWDKQKQHAKKSLPHSVELNHKLDTIRSGIKSEILKLESESKYNKVILTEAMIRTAINKYFNIDAEKKLSFFEALDYFKEARGNDIALTTLKKVTTLKNHLLEFQKIYEYKISFESINMDFYDKFRNFQWKEKNNSNTTAYAWIKFLKLFLSWCTDRGYNTKLDYKKFKIISDKTNLVHLTDEEVFRLLFMDLGSNKSLSDVRDTFCFACLTGARYSDITNIAWVDIKNNSWELRTIKTGDPLIIPLNEYALSILEKHKDEPKPLRVISNQKMNEYLKDLCEKAEINDPINVTTYIGKKRIDTIYKKYQLIGTHTARRTFITNALERGIKDEVVMSITGHSDYRTFQKYIRITDKAKRAAMDNLPPVPTAKKKNSKLKIVG